MGRNVAGCIATICCIVFLFPLADGNATIIGDGDVNSTVEINDSTTNGPTLSNSDFYATSLGILGDLDGDGVTDIAVGAFLDDDSGSGRGAVHIHFLNTDGSVKSTVEINDSTTNGPTLNDNDNYGFSVTNIGDLDGDGVQDLAVGARNDDAGGVAAACPGGLLTNCNRGAVHIHFMNTDGSVKSTVEINDDTPNGPTLDDSDLYGWSVTNIGDLDGDGVQDLAVGAVNDDAGGTPRGAVHIHFMNTDGSVKSTVEINDNTLNGPTLVDGDRYGYGLANIGDLDGDGVQDLAVGAVNDDAGGTNRGAVHISFMNTDGSVKSTVEINDSTTNGPTLSNSDFYGSSLTSLGDLNGDGTQDLAVGAPTRSAIHISFMNTDGSVDSTVEINDSTTNGPTLSVDDQYGRSVGDLGDLNGDGVTDIAVGANSDAGLGSLRGAVHIHFLKPVISATDTRGGGGGGGDKTPPSIVTTFGDADYPVSVGTTSYTAEQLKDSVDTTPVETGKPLQISLSLYDNVGPKNIGHVAMYVDRHGTAILGDLTETYIVWDRNKDIQIINPYGIISDGTVESSIQGNKASFTFDVTFAKEFDKSDILFVVWDAKRNSMRVLVQDALQVIPAEPVPELDVVQDSEPGAESVVTMEEFATMDPEPEVPDWVKTNAKWWSEGQVDDQAFVDGIGFLIKEKIIEITDLPSQASETAEEKVPDWIKNNAGWWANGLIPEDDFVKGIQYLVEQGIIKV